MGGFGGPSVSYAEHKTQTCAFYVIQRAGTHTPTHTGKLASCPMGGGGYFSIILTQKKSSLLKMGQTNPGLNVAFKRSQ